MRKPRGKIDTDGKWHRLKWWSVGKQWKCFGCGRRYKPEEIETTAPLSPDAEGMG